MRFPSSRPPSSRFSMNRHPRVSDFPGPCRLGRVLFKLLSRPRSSAPGHETPINGPDLDSKKVPVPFLDEG